LSLSYLPGGPPSASRQPRPVSSRCCSMQLVFYDPLRLCLAFAISPIFADYHASAASRPVRTRSALSDHTNCRNRLF
jgi:hypothetical protein